MPKISQATKRLIQEYQSWHQSLGNKEGVAVVHVDEVASKVAAFYEKLREIVDWKEKHLMRRAAIERNLKRRILLAGEEKEIAEPLVLELIRGGHFLNNKIEETKISEVEQLLKKYIYILENSRSDSSEKQKIELYNWLFSVAACEIEEILSSSRRERVLINYMTELMIERIKIQQPGIFSITAIAKPLIDKQVYIACQRALFKMDSPVITYHLLKKKYDQWANPSLAELEQISRNIYSTWQEIEKELNHPLKDKFYKICQRYNTPYLLLGDVLTELNQPEIHEIISQPEKLEQLIRAAYNKRLSTLKNRLSRAAIYSTLSILITNSLALFLLEVPLAKIIMGTFSYSAIAVDILGPTFLMFFLVATVRPPSKNNLEIVLIEIMKIVYETEKIDIYEIKIPKKNGFIMKFFIALLYLLGALISLAIITAVLRLANLPFTSYLVNIMFVALIAFAGLAIRNKGEELTVEEKKPGFFDFLFDILFLPIVGLGKWLSNKWKKYNIVTIFFNALIDLPWQIFVEFLEQWRYFLKEKKDEIY